MGANTIFGTMGECEWCSGRHSQAECNSAFLEFAANALTSSMTAGGAGSVFFDALGAAEACYDVARDYVGERHQLPTFCGVPLKRVQSELPALR